jgi:hypothetical protein
MNHDSVGDFMTEKYLLNELDPKTRDEFEEHFFGCQKCAADVHAGASFVQESKAVFAEKPLEPFKPPIVVPPNLGWLAWLRAGIRPELRPLLGLPVMALLLVVIGYQNLVTYPRLTRQLNRPRVLTYASLNVGAYGAEATPIAAQPGEGFLLFARISPVGEFSNYKAELRGPSGKVESSLTFPATPGKDQYPIHIPAANWAAGSYTLAVHGVTAAGESKDIGQALFELQIQR